jgi:hypothetical protein
MLAAGEDVETGSSALRAMVTMAMIRSCSAGTRPLVGSGVTSPTLKTPNCMQPGYSRPASVPAGQRSGRVRCWLP